MAGPHLMPTRIVPIRLRIGDGEEYVIGSVDLLAGATVHEAAADALVAAAAVMREIPAIIAQHQAERTRADQAETAPMGNCACGKWPAYFGTYDADGHTLRCRGCLLAAWRCTCR